MTLRLICYDSLRFPMVFYLDYRPQFAIEVVEFRQLKLQRGTLAIYWRRWLYVNHV